MKRLLIFMLSVLLPLVSFAQNSSIDFKIKNLGITVEGHFKIFTITAKFNNAGTLEALTGKIKANSIDTGIDSRDKHLLKEDYFDANKFEFITLESTSVFKVYDSEYIVKANLSIKGITKKTSIVVKVKRLQNNYKIISNFEINRRDFNVGGSSFIMSKTVKLSVIHYQNL